MEGSVDEESTKSDEEYDDLAMRDGQENGYWSDDNEGNSKSNNGGSNRPLAEKYNGNPSTRDHLDQVSEALWPYSSFMLEKTQRYRKRSVSDVKLQGRSQSIPAIGRYGSFSGPILTGTPERSNDGRYCTGF